MTVLADIRTAPIAGDNTMPRDHADVRSGERRQEYPHEFPIHHTDVMQQWIVYKASPEMYDGIAAYDGSVVLGLWRLSFSVVG